MKQKHFIDSHKCATFIFIASLMWAYDQWHNQTAWLYMAMHGAYGVLWFVKSRVFPDKNWEAKASLSYGIVIWGLLSFYWLAPIIIIKHRVDPQPWYAFGCLLIYIFGVFLHFTADMEKYISLKLRPNHLVTTGLWTHVRNPNYLGELLIYLSFALLSQHWAPITILAVFVGLVWVPNMMRKDRSLSRYADFREYGQRTWCFIPFVW